MGQAKIYKPLVCAVQHLNKAPKTEPEENRGSLLSDLSGLTYISIHHSCTQNFQQYLLVSPILLYVSPAIYYRIAHLVILSLVSVLLSTKEHL